MAKCCDITPGMLRHTATVQRASLSVNGSGGRAKTWATLLTIRCAVVNKGGLERVTADRVDASRRVEFTCRYFAGLLEGDRIVFNGLAHNIRYIDNVEYANRWMIVNCDQGVAT